MSNPSADKDREAFARMKGLIWAGRDEEAMEVFRAALSSCAPSERQRHMAWNVIHKDHHLGQEEVRELARAVLALPESEAIKEGK